jgi:hypothetical protein
LWRLERLNTVIDKTPVDDPARPYLQAEAREITAWWAATNSTRLSLAAIALVIFELWLVVVAVMSIIWPAPEAMGNFPLVQWWATVPIGTFSLLRLLMAARRRRADRVRFYNTLIESGPEEFKTALKKRFRVPALGSDFSEDEALKRPGPRATGHHLEVEKIRTCPNGHPVTGGNLYFSDWDIDNEPPRWLLCGRCGVPLPRPLTRDVDEEEASLVATVRYRRRKAEAKAAAERSAAERAATEQAGTDNDPPP